MHRSSQMQHLGGGQHWCGQGMLEGFCTGMQRFGASHESNNAEDSFRKLLASFEAQELASFEPPELPSTLHQSLTLTPLSRRQRKNCRPLRVPPTFESVPPIRDDIKACFREGPFLVEQHLLPSVKNCSNGGFFESEDKGKTEPVSSSPKSATHVENLSQNRINDDHPLPTNLNFQTVMTQQENGLDVRNLPSARRYAQVNGKHSNGTSICEIAGPNSLPNLQQIGTKFDSHNTSVCRNGACQAKISSEASFCRRCSCCICKLFDNERDPSLWIVCDPTLAGGCGLSCHIECALKQQVAGVVMSTDGTSLDGSFYCSSCHSIMPLVCCWSQQLLAAKNALTLDSLHYRLLLSYRLLKGTKLYGDILGPVKEAMKRVNAEVTQMALGSGTRLQCSVDLLSCKRDVQKLIALALEKVDGRTLAIMGAMEQSGQNLLPFMVCFEDVSPSSIVLSVSVRGSSRRLKLLGYKIWHRKASEIAYEHTPTGILYNMDDKCVVSNLDPLTDYTFKVVPFSMDGDLAVCEAGCSTKGVEHAEQPVDVFTSLGVVVINAETVDGGISKCINPSFNLDRHVDNGKNGLKLQDLEEVMVDHNEGGRHSSSMPTTDNGQNGKCDSYRNVVSVYSKRGASVKDERRNQIAQRNALGEPEERNFNHVNTLMGSSTSMQMQTRTGNMGQKINPYSSFNGWDHSFPRKRLKNGNEEQYLFDSAKECQHTVSSKHLCMSDRNISSQNWGIQSDRGDNVVMKTKKQAELESDHGSDHAMHGIFICNSEADFQSYEFSVKVIRWLESKGHLKEEFRMKFLTWFTLKASEQEKRVISVFIDTLQDDPVSLAGQLVDAFEELIEISKCQTPMDGFCRRLW